MSEVQAQSEFQRSFTVRPIGVIPKEKTRGHQARDHALGLLRLLVETYPKEAVEMVRKEVWGKEK